MIKDVKVQLDGTAEDEVRLEHAEALASLSNGHLTGLYANPLPDYGMTVPFDAGGAAAEVLVEIEEQARREGDAAGRRLQERFARLGVSHELRRLEGRPGELQDLVAAEARCADVLVATRPYGAGALATLVAEAVLFQGGRALYLVPPGRGLHQPFRTVLVAWRDTREAARAVREGLPFIEASSRVVLVLVDPERADDGRGEPEADAARHLSRHGAAVEVKAVESGGRAVSEVLLEEAARVSADLVVMGAYGHSRVRQWILGGTTRDMLTLCDRPILMAH